MIGTDGMKEFSFEDDDERGREYQIQRTLDLLRERGERGILSTEALDLGIWRLQARIRDLRVRGHVIASIETPGSEVVRYVYGVKPGRTYVEAWQAGVKSVYREGRGWSVEVMGTSKDQDRALRAAEVIRAALATLEPEPVTQDQQQPEPVPADEWSEWLAEVERMCA